jgi:CRP/FNR family transcriptional regulator, cyclic AMP receptor protein
MMTLSDIAGYVASTMVLLTFLTKDMRLLRVLAIFSNIAFVTYGMLVWLPPVFCLHLLLLPVNALRLREMLTTQS